jgi:hypothetical protein
MLRDGELVHTHRGKHLTVARRNRDPAFAIQRQRCGALKHDVRHKTPPKCTLRHCSGRTAWGQFAGETKINGINDLVGTVHPLSGPKKRVQK